MWFYPIEGHIAILKWHSKDADTITHNHTQSTIGSINIMWDVRDKKISQLVVSWGVCMIPTSVSARTKSDDVATL